MSTALIALQDRLKTSREKVYVLSSLQVSLSVLHIHIYIYIYIYIYLQKSFLMYIAINI
jgi:hypothetical protein